jgi:hypothetical protein
MLRLAISDTAQVFISLGPAAITGAVGYFGARLQYQVGERGREAEARALRREVYHRCLYNLQAQLRYLSRAEPVSDEKTLEIQRGAHTRVAEVYLVATDDVVDAAAEWSGLAQKVYKEVLAIAGRSITARHGPGAEPPEETPEEMERGIRKDPRGCP